MLHDYLRCCSVLRSSLRPFMVLGSILRAPWDPLLLLSSSLLVPLPFAIQLTRHLAVLTARASILLCQRPFSALLRVPALLSLSLQPRCRARRSDRGIADGPRHVHTAHASFCIPIFLREHLANTQASHPLENLPRSLGKYFETSSRTSFPFVVGTPPFTTTLCDGAFWIFLRRQSLALPRFHATVGRSCFTLRDSASPPSRCCLCSTLVARKLSESIQRTGAAASSLSVVLMLLLPLSILSWIRRTSHFAPTHTQNCYPISLLAFWVILLFLPDVSFLPYLHLLRANALIALPSSCPQPHVLPVHSSLLCARFSEFKPCAAPTSYLCLHLSKVSTR
jgi:prepilin signal peptidase PulO-like enzyme (type II secretory pathway)